MKRDKFKEPAAEFKNEAYIEEELDEEGLDRRKIENEDETGEEDEE